MQVSERFGNFSKVTQLSSGRTNMKVLTEEEKEKGMSSMEAMIFIMV